MSIYVYSCGNCGTFDVTQPFAADALTACPTCGAPVTRIPQAPAVMFLGTGWAGPSRPGAPNRLPISDKARERHPIIVGADNARR